MLGSLPSLVIPSQLRVWSAHRNAAAAAVWLKEEGPEAALLCLPSNWWTKTPTCQDVDAIWIFLYMSVVIYGDDNLRDFWQQVRHVKRRNDQKLSLSGYPYIYN